MVGRGSEGQHLAGSKRSGARTGCESPNARTTMMLALVLMSVTTGACRAQSGSALMAKMVAAYQHLTTYEGTSNVDLTLMSGKQVLRSQSISNKLQVQRPNKLVLIVQNSGPTGTRSIYSDGVNMTIYDALPNRYAVSPTAADMSAMLRLLATQAHISAELDPLYFLCINKLPPNLVDLKAAGSATVNGRPSIMVTGNVPALPAVTTSGLKKPPTSTMHWIWYIDRETFLLNKIEAYSDPVTMPVNKRINGKLVKTTIAVMLKLRHNVNTVMANPRLDAGVFAFKAPAGAVEQKSASQLLKGAR